MSEELKPCPFCGEIPDLPSGDGTYYVIECEKCGGAVVGIQISDLMTIEERRGDPFTNYRYAEQYIERAKAEAIKQWNTRATPPAAQVQGEQPEVVGQLALDEPFNGTEGLELGEWEFVPERAVVESMLAESTGEMVPLMTVAQYERTVAALEGERAEQWRLRRDFEARCDTQAAEIAELRAALSAPPAAGVPTMGARPQTCNGKRCGWCKEGSEPCHYIPPASEQPFELRLCEQRHTVLKPGLLYHFTADPECQGCQDIVAILNAAPPALPVATTPPASEQQQAVVLPEPMYVVYGEGDEGRRKEGWNDYYNALLRLNPHLAGVNQGVTTEAGNGGEA